MVWNKGIVILGPTASGKTQLAVRLAGAIGGEILSADSRQIYRGMDIGTGKDLEEYSTGAHKAPYHLIDLKDAGDTYHINQYYLDYEAAAKDVIGRGKRIILCGGSGLYLQTAVEGNALASIPTNEHLRSGINQLKDDELLDIFNSLPQHIQDTHDSSTRKRIIRAIEIGKWLESNPVPVREDLALDYTIFGIDIDRELRRERISNRLEHRLENGMVEEIEVLLKAGVSVDSLRWYGLEYKWIADYLEGNMSLSKMHSGLETAIHQFAKRQMTFFRSLEKKGWMINWLDGSKSLDLLVEDIKKFEKG